MQKTHATSFHLTYHFDPAALKVLGDSEHAEQRAFVSWWRKSFSDNVRLFAIPNGGHRSKSQGAILKAEGVVPGVPDLFCPALGLWIEFKKRSGGKVSREQADWHQYLQCLGYTVIVAHGADDAVEQVIGIINHHPQTA